VWISCSRIGRVVSYKSDSVVKMCGMMVSSVILSAVPISYLWMAISFVFYCITVLPSNCLEVVNVHSTRL
jgi:hypothetical protein